MTQPTIAYVATSRRGLILHDTLAFLALLGTSVALFGVTLFLFKSFQAHRVELAERWSQRGREDLARNQPAEAVGALRTALSYDSGSAGERADQLLLAEALDASGHTDEAIDYFLNLRDSMPGDGSINLQLARLARQKGDDPEAADYYRAAIYGSWEGDGIVRRREARLELAGFLIERHHVSEARNELFTVAGNAASDVRVLLDVAARLDSAGLLQDALTIDRKAAAADPHARLPLALAGMAAYKLGEYPEAERLLNHALAERPARNQTPEQERSLEVLAEEAHRIQQLNLTRDQSAEDRAEHLLSASRVAQARLRSCLKVDPSPTLAGLNVRWAAADAGASSRRTLLRDATAQDAWTHLIYATEQSAAPPLDAGCGAPTGDDALLLLLANAAQPVIAPAPEAAGAIDDAPRPSLVRRIFGGGSNPKPSIDEPASKEQPPHGK